MFKVETFLFGRDLVHGAESVILPASTFERIVWHFHCVIMGYNPGEMCSDTTI